MSNPCTRCGNERVFSKTWEESVFIYGRQSIIIHTDFVCADPECQARVESELVDQKARKVLMEQQKEKEKQIRIRNAIRAKKQASSVL